MFPPSRTYHVLAALLMAAYVVAVLAGKIAAATGKPNPLALGDVGEFLVVLASIVLFVTGVLAAPARADNNGGDPR
jgi:hypothetical protein